MAKADALSLEGPARLDYLRRKGGTSPWAGGIALLVLILMFVCAFANPRGW